MAEYFELYFIGISPFYSEYLNIPYSIYDLPISGLDLNLIFNQLPPFQTMWICSAPHGLDREIISSLEEPN